MSDVLLKHSRMPRKYEPKPPANKPSGYEQYGNLTGVDPKEILKRYLSDETTLDIAGSYSVTRQALSKFLLKHAEEDWKEAQVARAIARKEKAEDDLELAQDPLALAKARELLKAAQWDLERTCRRIYGEDKQTVQVVTPVLNITISGNEDAKAPVSIQVEHAHAQGRLIDVQPQQSGAASEVADCDADIVHVQSST